MRHFAGEHIDPKVKQGSAVFPTALQEGAVCQKFKQIQGLIHSIIFRVGIQPFVCRCEGTPYHVATQQVEGLLGWQWYLLSLSPWRTSFDT